MAEIKKYANNSDANKEVKMEQTTKKVDKVTSGNVRTKKKSKIASSFISEDLADVKDYIVGDILVPTIKKTIASMVSNGMDMLLFGEVRSDRDHKSGSRADRVSYRDYYDRDRRDSRDRRSRVAYDYDDIILDNRGEAERVLDSMGDIIDRYGAVSITDLYDLVGYSGGRYTDNKYGWTTVRGMDVQRTRDGGYLLKLPAARPID